MPSREVELAQAAVAEPPAAPSVYAGIRAGFLGLQPQRLKKSTLIALSWAIEDECCARAERPVIFGAFQHERYFRAAEERWTELARIARSTMVFADFASSAESAGGASLVHLPADAPMRREWVVVCDAPDYPAMLTAWELPGQSTVPDRQRLFEAIWTVEPGRRANCRSHVRAGGPAARPDRGGPAPLRARRDPPPSPAELAKAMGLLNRVVAYVDGVAL